MNFTAALVPASFGSDVLGRIFRRQSLHDAAWWMLVYAAAITPFTVIAGLWWKRSIGEGLPPSLLLTHQWLGISLAVIFVALTLWRWTIFSRSQTPGFSYLLLAFIVVLALAFQGSLGGRMLFGS